MEVEIGRGKKARRAYGFDDIAIVPSRRTRDPDDIDITWKIGPYRFELPMLACAMDGVVSPTTAGIDRPARWPGGAQPRRASSRATRTPMSSSSGSPQLPKDQATREMQEIYSEPVKPELIAQRIREIKEHKVVVRRVADAAARAPTTTSSRWRPASTCS